MAAVLLCVCAVALWAGCGGGCGDETSRHDGGGEEVADGSGGDEPIAARVRQLIEQERFDEALRTIPANPDAELEALQERATAERVARDQLRLACMVTDGTDLEAVHEACLEIAPTSHYHDRGCCRGAAERYGEARLRAVPGINDTDGREHAQAAALDVAEDETMPTALRERARQLAARYEPLPEAGPGDGGVDVAATAGGTPTGGGGDQAERVEEAFAARALQQARVAIEQGNQQGCIGALRTAPRTDQVVSLLINCYARAGNLRAACEEARRNRGVPYARQFSSQRCR